MRQSIYVIVFSVLTISLYNCAPESTSFEEDIAFVNVNDADLFSSRSSNVQDINDDKACFKHELSDKNDQSYGIMLVSVNITDLTFDFHSYGDWKLKETYLSIVDCSKNDMPLVVEGETYNTDLFQHSGDHPVGRNNVNYSIDMTDMDSQVCYVAFAVLEHYKYGKRYVMAGEWLDSVEIELLNCADYVPDNWVRQCVDLPDLEFYIPLSYEASGDYPEAGTTSDSVTLTPEYPSTSGYVIMTMEFDNIPQDMKDIELSMSFSDLDLHTDVLQAGGNTARFAETLIISDTFGRNLAILDDNGSLDGDFEYVLSIDKELIQDGKIILEAKFSSHLELDEGPGLTASNSIEGCFNVSMCGLTNDVQ